MKVFLILISFIFGLIPSKRISNKISSKKLAYFSYFIIEAAKVLIPCFTYTLYYNNYLIMPILVFISLLGCSLYPLVPIYVYSPIIPYFIGSLILSPKVLIILILLFISLSFVLKEYLLAFLIISAVSPFIFILIEKSIPLFIFGMLSAGLFYLKYYFSKT